VSPILLAAVASACFALTYIFPRLAVQTVSSLLGGFISSLVVFALYLPWILWTFPGAAFLNPQLLWFIGIGVLIPGVSRSLQFEGVKRIGAAPSGLLRGLGPLFSTALAVLLLGERPSAQVLAGTFSIVAGIVVLSARRGEMRSWELSGILYGLAATLIWVSRDIVIRYTAPQVAHPALAIFVMAATSTLVMGAACLVWDRGAARRASWEGLGYFGLTGLAGFGALTSLFFALRAGEVVVVTPIVSAQPFFVLLFSLLLPKGMEMVTAFMALGCLLIVVGGVLIGTG